MCGVGLQSSTLSSVAAGGGVADGCRVAPYVALPSMRLTPALADTSPVNPTSTAARPPTPGGVSRPGLPALDPGLAAALAAAAAAAAGLPLLGGPAASALMAAAAAAAAANSMLLYGAGPPAPPPQYAGLGGLHHGAALMRSQQQQQQPAAAAATPGESVCSKNNSIAELRMKAKKYAAALGL